MTESCRLLVPSQRGSPKTAASQENSWKVLREAKLEAGGSGVPFIISAPRGASRRTGGFRSSLATYRELNVNPRYKRSCLINYTHTHTHGQYLYILIYMCPSVCWALSLGTGRALAWLEQPKSYNSSLRSSEKAGCWASSVR